MKKYSDLVQAAKMLEQHCSYSELIAVFGWGKSTVQLVKTRFAASGLTADELAKMEPDDVLEIFYPGFTQKQYSKQPPDFPKIFKRTHAAIAPTSLRKEWENYHTEYPEGYMYTEFRVLCNRWVLENYGDENVVMVLDRKPGEYIFVDWGGKTLPLVISPDDPGKLLTAHFFYTSLGVSGKIFVKAYPNEKEENVIDGMNCAFFSYNALPMKIRCDNMRTAITKNTKDELIVNKKFRDLSNYYDVIVIPAPRYTPRAYRQNQNIGNFTLLGHTYRT